MGFPPSIHDQGRESSVRFRPFGLPNVAQWQGAAKRKPAFRNKPQAMGIHPSKYNLEIVKRVSAFLRFLMKLLRKNRGSELRFMRK